jgi:hypothetical protein
MDPDALARQALVEHETLQHVVAALEITLDWQVAERDLATKISSVRFMAESFQRHLERLMSLEETGGYMESATEQQPHLWNQTVALRAEHEGFRKVFRQLMPSLRRVEPDDETHFDNLCHELRDLIRQVQEHGRAETALLQEAFLLEVGGEA